MSFRNAKLTPVDGLALKALRIANEISQEVLAALLDVHAGVLENWEAGASVPASMTERIGNVSLMIRHASRAAWKHRTFSTSGMEILLDRDLRIAAISRTALNTPFRELGFDAPTSLFVGSHIHNVLPSLDCTLVLNHGTGLNDLVDIGFFEGRVRFVRIAAEINFGLYAYCGVFEYWPVETCDAGIVVRQVSVLDLSRQTSLRKPGILVEGTEIGWQDRQAGG
ncbi:MAG: hypothetical protein KBA31_09760 [Alphaproteobacteria bacterium]|nr:hypothetical protein [Alphaproteobacteria bacterium]